MELVSLWNFGEHASEFKKFKYYFFKAFVSFSKLNWGLLSSLWKFLLNLLSLFFVAPNLYVEVSPTKKVLAEKSANYWSRTL